MNVTVPIGYSSKGSPTASIAPHEVMCATCEGRAVGAGLASIALVVKHPVKFQPR